MKKTLLFFMLLIVGYAGWSQTRDTTYFIYEDLKINSNFSESGPRISQDGKTLYFFRANHPKNLKGSNDIWVSNLTKDSSWSTPQRLELPLNNYMDNAVHGISADGKKMLLHDVYKKNLTSVPGLSVTEMQVDGTWSFPEALKIKNFEIKNTICSYYMTPDWKTLLLAVETTRTLGKQDLFISSFNEEDNSWSQPKNLGQTINTSGIEATPYLSTDKKTLYYSSNNLPASKGGFDIYMSSRLDDSWTNWSKPENLGTPYNTRENEFYFSVPENSNGWAYLSRSNNGKNAELARVRKVTESIPDPFVMYSGLALDSISGENLIANIYIKSLTNDFISRLEVDSVSPYSVRLKSYEKYSYTITKSGYDTLSGIIDLTSVEKAGEENLNFVLMPARRKADWTIKGLEFATGKWDIQPKYYEELDQALVYINEHPEIIFEIAGHTDNVGDEKANLKLSQNRAQAVVNYFAKKGIDKSHLVAVGYGETQPVAPNDTEEGRQHNRRVELIKN